MYYNPAGYEFQRQERLPSSGLLVVLHAHISAKGSLSCSCSFAENTLARTRQMKNLNRINIGQCKPHYNYNIFNVSYNQYYLNFNDFKFN